MSNFNELPMKEPFSRVPRISIAPMMEWTDLI